MLVREAIVCVLSDKVTSYQLFDIQKLIHNEVGADFSLAQIDAELRILIQDNIVTKEIGHGIHREPIAYYCIDDNNTVRNTKEENLAVMHGLYQDALDFHREIGGDELSDEEILRTFQEVLAADRLDI